MSRTVPVLIVGLLIVLFLEGAAVLGRSAVASQMMGPRMQQSPPPMMGQMMQDPQAMQSMVQACANVMQDPGMQQTMQQMMQSPQMQQMMEGMLRQMPQR